MHPRMHANVRGMVAAVLCLPLLLCFVCFVILRKNGAPYCMQSWARVEPAASIDNHSRRDVYVPCRLGGVCLLQDKISAEDKAELEKRMEQLRGVLGEGDADTLRAKVKELQELSWKVSQQAYSSQVGDDSDGKRQLNY